ncbi:MAG: sulfite exporter TauE/SafE family protein [Alphaproteobacteria bacterium]|nr:sulfite exporter TauE/SafE family protein [Alphaproteobacteria bacterium]MCY4230304.1 sulfite exporter TauE/SafE family protein [Alphaproteobacteria bacterium]MCY4318800.1 sulfite exporter TauE/SafE family protein [Alphaproteobacteria bacterium]
MIDWAAPEPLATIAAAFLVAAFVKGLTGLGFSTCALPLLALSIGIREALPLVLAPSIASNLLVMRGAGHFRETVWRFWPLGLAALPGIAFGIILLVWIDPLAAGAALGAVLVGYATFALARPALALPPRLERPLQWPVGFVNGAVNGLTGSQVMPLLPYLLALQLDPGRFVQAINCVFTVSSLAMIVGLSQAGLLTGPAVVLSVLGLLPVWVGVTLGEALRRRLPADSFRKAVLGLLILLGAILAARFFLG